MFDADRPPPREILGIGRGELGPMNHQEVLGVAAPGVGGEI
jgi:hypothetical protein